MRDLRFALRAIRNNPGFTAAVVLTLALGIVANTAIFSVVHAVLLEPIAYPAETPEDVVVLAESAPRGGRMGVSYPTFVDWLEQVQSFELMAGFRGSSYNLTSRDEPLRARVLMTSASYFDIHIPRDQLGRGRGRGAARGAALARVSAHSVASSRRRRLRVVDCVHECREFTARTLDDATTRDGDLLGARSEPGNAHPTSARGEPRARRARRDCRSGDGQRGPLLDPVVDAVRSTAFGERRPVVGAQG